MSLQFNTKELYSKAQDLHNRASSKREDCDLFSEWIEAYCIYIKEYQREQLFIKYYWDEQ